VGKGAKAVRFKRSKRRRRSHFGGANEAFWGDVGLGSFGVQSRCEFGKGLMLIAMLGAMRDPDVRVFLMDLLGQPVPGAPDPAGVRATTYDDEVGYRRQALHILNAYGAPATTAAVMDVAKNHPIAELRNAAIQTLRYQKSPAEIEALRAELRPEDEFYLDLPRRSSPSFDADTVQFRAKYSN
jgi:hypothetical protein